MMRRKRGDWEGSLAKEIQNDKLNPMALIVNLFSSTVSGSLQCKLGVIHLKLHRDFGGGRVYMIFHWLNGVDFNCFLPQDKTEEAAHNSGQQDWRDHSFFEMCGFVVP